MESDLVFPRPLL